MHLAIGQRDYARKPRPRHIRQGRPKRGKQRRATLAGFRHLHHPQIKRRQARGGTPHGRVQRRIPGSREKTTVPRNAQNDGIRAGRNTGRGVGSRRAGRAVGTAAREEHERRREERAHEGKVPVRGKGREGLRGGAGVLRIVQKRETARAENRIGTARAGRREFGWRQPGSRPSGAPFR